MIGLLGGTFNPVHLGHLSIAKDVLKFIPVNKVHFLPCNIPVHRELSSTSTAQRVAMLRLALQNEEQLELNMAEIERGGASYMIDTLQGLVKDSEETIALMLGTDAFNALHTWKHAQKILNYCHIVVCQRPDEMCQQMLFKHHVVDDVNQLSIKQNGCIYFLSVSPVPCSSTFIRKNSANNAAIAQFLPHPVLEFMQLNQLYELSKN